MNPCNRIQLTRSMKINGKSNNHKSGRIMCDYLWGLITRFFQAYAPRIGRGAEREREMKKETLEKITTWLCWSIFMAGVGYSWGYYHWMMWAAAKGLAL